ncbi:MAG: hypothetical protein AB2A00_29580 [Myxococcota bacterium]
MLRAWVLSVVVVLGAPAQLHAEEPPAQTTPSDEKPEPSRNLPAPAEVQRLLRVLSLPAYALPSLVWGAGMSAWATVAAVACGTGCSGTLLAFFLPLSATSTLLLLSTYVLGYVGIYAVLLMFYAPYFWLYLAVPMVVLDFVTVALQDRELFAPDGSLDSGTALRLVGLGVRSLAAWLAGWAASFAMWAVQAVALAAGVLVLGTIGWGICMATGGATFSAGRPPTSAEQALPWVLGAFVAGTVWAYGALPAFVPLGVHALVLILFRPEDLFTRLSGVREQPGAEPAADSLEPEQL